MTREAWLDSSILVGRPELSSFSQVYTVYAGERGSMVAVRFKKNVDYDALHFHKGSLKINIFKVLSWERVRVSQKRLYSVYAFDNVDYSG